MFYRQNLYNRPLYAGILVALLLCDANVGEESARAAGEKAAPAVLYAENAVTRLAQGDFAEAARQTRLGMRAVPGNPLLALTGGVILLDAGNPKAARSAFTDALAADPDDALTLYGLGLAQLGCGDRRAALNSLARARQHDGDRAYCTLAERYTQWLDGVHVAVEGAGVPENLQPAMQALQGMEAARRGLPGQATVPLTQALDSLPGDGILQPGGLLMTFDPAHPLAVADRGRADLSGLTAPARAKGDVSGTLVLTANNAPDSTTFVSFEMDGQSLSMSNTRPFGLNWDSRTVGNGWHTLSIITYDAQGSVITRTTRRLRTLNTRLLLPPDAQNGERETRLRAALWQALTLQPDRAACGLALGDAQRKMGDNSKARLSYARALAVQPDRESARQQLAALGGIGAGQPAVWRGLSNEKIVALTFDDGPKPGVTEPLLDVLTDQRTPATFFVIGRHVMEYPELTRKIADAGMELANHSYTHRNLTKLPDADVARELLQTQAAVQIVTGKTMRYMRPPGGNWNERVAGVTKHWGLTACMWTVDVYGSEVIGAQQVADAVLAQVRPGSIVLMHNGKLSTLQALPTIIRELHRRGYTFATVDALVKRLALARANAAAAARFPVSGTVRKGE